MTATQDETESAPATESAPENEQRFAAQTVHSFNFQIMIDRFGQHPPTLLVEEWENRTRYHGLEPHFFRMTQSWEIANAQAAYWREYFELRHQQHVLDRAPTSIPKRSKAVDLRSI